MKRPRTQAEEPRESSFGDILSQFEQEQKSRAPEPPAPKGPGRAASASVRRGTIVSVGPESVLVDFGAKSEGVIATADLRDRSGNITVKVGEEIDVSITGRNADGLVTLSRVTGPRPRDWQALQEAFQAQQVIAGRVTGVTKGGLTVDVGARAFLPASRSGARDQAEMDRLLDQEIRCRIIQFEPDDNNVVVDRRVVLEEEARQARESTMATLQEGGIVRGSVRSLTDFGAFIDLGGVDGLLHVGDISWSRVKDPRSELQVGETLDLKVLRLDRDTGKISLGLKQMYPDPWDSIASDFAPGDRVRGTVTKLTDFGAFIEVRPGVEGMVHVSEMSWTKRVRKPSDILKRGEDVEAVVLKLDAAQRRLSLGLKQVLGNPWDTIAERYPAGTVVEGVVRRLAKFGAFVEVEEGIEGLLHVSDLTGEKRVEHPSEIVKVGDQVKAIVLEADAEKRRLKLGMKQLEATTMDEFLREHKAGDKVTGRVVSVSETQATVQLGEGVEAICPLAGAPKTAEPRGALGAALAAAWKGPLPTPSAPPAEPLREGQLRSFIIQRVDPSARRIELAAA